MSLFGPCLRRIEPTPGAPRSLYLTFDDGPDPAGTALTLDVLARHGAKATFFVVAERARAHPDLLRRIKAEGHAVGNHSLDHKQSTYFRGEAKLYAWIRDAESLLRDLLGEATVGFRSPNGIRTPPLDRVLGRLGLPLIHWNVRFYDAVWPWTEKRALASLATTAPGSIVLLHDRQKPGNSGLYLKTLEAYVREAKSRRHSLQAITPEDAAAHFLEHGEARRWQT